MTHQKYIMTAASVAKIAFLCLSFCLISSIRAQVSYSASALFGLRKTDPSYTGSAIQIRRTCDNATVNIGFTACGHLDTAALKTFVLVPNPLSAISSSAAAAFSLRRLRCAYAGSAIRVRRSSDNTQADIGFNATGDLDTITMKTFVGANNAFVTIWYDQSGNARNASQATAANQPRIISAGVIEKQGGRPAVYWQGMGNALLTANFTAYATAACFNAVGKVNVDLTYNALVNKCQANIPGPLDLYNGQMVIGNGSSYNFYGYGQTLNAAKPLSVWTYQGAAAGAYNFYYNGALSGTGSVGFFGDNATPLVLGSRIDLLTGLNGWISEAVTFAVIPSNAERQYLEWSQSQYYNISGITLGTLPPFPASAFVTTWYDQSGNANDLSQTTTASQPVIINSGILTLKNTRPVILLDGANTFLRQTTLNISNPYTANAIATRTVNGGSGGFQRLINMSATGDAYGYLGVLSGNYATFTGTVSAWNDINANLPLAPVALNTPCIMSMAASAGVTGLIPYLNGTQQTPKVGTATAATGFLVGAPYSATATNQLWAGNISEFSIFPSALSTTRRALLETNEAVYHNLTVSNSKYTPPTATSYNLFVNGIGYTSATDSVAGTRSTAGMGFISQGATGFLKDAGDFITAGMDCPVTSSVSTANLPATVVQRWLNDWYVNKTDVFANSGILRVYFDFSDYGIGILPGVAANYVLLSRSLPSANFSVVAGTTVTVNGDKVLFDVSTTNIATNFYYTIGTMSTNVSPLPIELTAFDAACSNNEVKITWSTATEKNNDYFSVERSADGITYEAVHTVKGSLQSYQPLNYSFTDQAPLSGYSYYRLKQTDLDRTEKYFSPVSVSCTGALQQLIVYPNPSNKDLIIEGCPKNTIITIMNQLGQTMISREALSSKTELDVSSLAEGIYFLKAESVEASFIKKIVVQH